MTSDELSQEEKTRGFLTRPKNSQNVINTFLYILVAVGAVIFLLPIAYMVSSSFKLSSDIFKVPIQWIPSPFILSNYSEAMKIAPFGRYFANSLFVSGITTLLNIFFASLAGYGFAKYRFLGKHFMFMAILSTLMIPFQAIMVPLFMIVRNFNWLNTFQGLIIPWAISAFGVFLMRQFINSIPDELLDAARIDGASELGIFWHIILPLSKAPIITLAIFTFLDSWNNLLWPLIIITKPEMRTVALGLTEFQTLHGTAYNLLMTGSTISIIPILIMFIFLQRYFIRGVVLSGLKG
jgi:multiple sugar transport system permease protein